MKATPKKLTAISASATVTRKSSSRNSPATP
jgi:hypothetical protein